MTARLLEARRPDALTHVFDHTIAPAERLQAFPGYKARRAPDPDALPGQFDLLEEVLDAFGSERAMAEGWEADDAIGALCAGARVEDRIEIVTGDRDLLQLVRDEGPVVCVLFTLKGVSALARFDEAAVRAKYGIPPERYVDFAILRGDPSDGLPGVPGVGEKTARDLLVAHGNLERLLAEVERPGYLPKGLGARLLAARAYLEAMRTVVPVRANVRVSIRRDEPDIERLAHLAESRRLKGPVQRLAKALGSSAAR